MSDLTHFDEHGRARMVDVGAKPETHRIALARGEVRMRPETLRLILEGRAEKGDVLGVARVAAIMAAKKTSDLIPMCHPLMLTAVAVEFQPDLARGTLEVAVRVETRGKTGVEMEALAAVSVAALTVYDMVKAVDRGMMIGEIRLEEKSGGRSATWHRDSA